MSREDNLNLIGIALFVLYFFFVLVCNVIYLNTIGDTLPFFLVMFVFNVLLWGFYYSYVRDVVMEKVRWFLAP